MHDNNVIGWPANAKPSQLVMHKLYCDLIIGRNFCIKKETPIEIDANAEKLAASVFHFPTVEMMAVFELEFNLKPLIVTHSLGARPGAKSYIQLRNEFPDDIFEEFISSVSLEREALLRTIKSAGELTLNQDNALATMYLVANNLNGVHEALVESFALLAERVKERELQDT